MKKGRKDRKISAMFRGGVAVCVCLNRREAGRPVLLLLLLLLRHGSTRLLKNENTTKRTGAGRGQAVTVEPETHFLPNARGAPPKTRNAGRGRGQGETGGKERAKEGRGGWE